MIIYLGDYGPHAHTLALSLLGLALMTLLARLLDINSCGSLSIIIFYMQENY